MLLLWLSLETAHESWCIGLYLLIKIKSWIEEGDRVSTWFAHNLLCGHTYNSLITWERVVPIYANLLPDRLNLPQLGCASSTQAQFSCLPPLFHKTSLGLEGNSYPALLHEIFCFLDSSKDGLINPVHANESAVVSQGSILYSCSTEIIYAQATSGLKVATSQLIQLRSRTDREPPYPVRYGWLQRDLRMRTQPVQH